MLILPLLSSDRVHKALRDVFPWLKVSDDSSNFLSYMGAKRCSFFHRKALFVSLGKEALNTASIFFWTRTGLKLKLSTSHDYSGIYVISLQKESC